MKRIRPLTILQGLVFILLFSGYWYWVNNKLIPDTDQAFGLTTYFVMISFSTAFFPLPANLLTLGAVKHYDPFLVAILGGLASLVAFFLEYQFFKIMFKFKRVSEIKKSWIYQKLKPLFSRQQFLILSVLSFLPISSEPIRLYAISTGYPVLSFVLAGFVGRLPRYFLLGYYGKPYISSIWFIAAVVLFPVFFLFLLKGLDAIWKVLHKRTLPEGQEAAVTVPASSLKQDSPE